MKPKWKVEIDGGWVAITLLIIGAIMLAMKGNESWEWMIVLAGAGMYIKSFD